MFQNLYKKNINKHERQEVRRKILLEQQKRKRYEQQDIHRYDEDLYDDKKKKAGHMKCKGSIIENMELQLSEWFKEKPENFNDWLMVPCPKGQRCLVVAEKGKTKMYSKNKRYRMTFPSLLPGGGLNCSDDYCILDCIFNEPKDTFYVLDALHFAIPLKHCDTDFRFFWLKSKFDELECLEEKYKCDKRKSFQLLENYDVSNEERLRELLQTYPLWLENQPQLDGFLFYHKKSHYVYGSTPLVCWLFPFMVPDVLQMTVCKDYKPPTNYCSGNPWQYMDEFDQEMARKRNKKSVNFSSMEDVDTERQNLNSSVDHEDIFEMSELSEIY